MTSPLIGQENWPIGENPIARVSGARIGNQQLRPGIDRAGSNQVTQAPQLAGKRSILAL
jgi:hypothetical protein